MAFVRRREIPLLITAASALIVLITFFFKVPPAAGTTIMEWAVVLGAFAMGLASIVLIRYHIGVFMRRVPGQWMFSAWFLIVTAVMTIFGLWGMAVGGGNAMTNPVYSWMMEYIYSPLCTTQYGITGFFVLSACYRGLRARSLESLVVIIIAFFMMMKNITIGEVIWTGFPVVGNWLFTIPAVAGWRGTWIASEMGVIAFAIRLLGGRERGYLRE